MTPAARNWQVDLLNPVHENCNHRAYSLTCSDLEEIVQRANGRCELCSIPGVATPHRKLHIDHDEKRGYWAVRGLLCSRCNTCLERSSTNSAARDAYLARAWYLAMLRNEGITPDRWIEPDHSLTIHGGRNGRRYRWAKYGRERWGWVPIKTNGALLWSVRPATWGDLLYQFGPHRLHAK